MNIKISIGQQYSRKTKALFNIRLGIVMFGYGKAIKQLAPAAKWLIFSEICFGMTMGLSSLVLNLYFLSKGVNEEAIGHLTSVSTLIGGAVGIPASMLAGRLGRKRIMVIGISLMSGSFALFAVSDHLLLYYCAQAMLSCGIVFIVATETQLLFQYNRSREAETQAYSLFLAVFMFFNIGGTLLGGYLPRWLGTPEDNYEPQLWLAAIFMLLLAIIRGLKLPSDRHAAVKQQTREVHHPGDDRPTVAANARKTGAGSEDRAAVVEKSASRKFARSLAQLLPTKQVWLLSGFIFISGIAGALTMPFLNVIVKYQLDWENEAVSSLLAANYFFLFIGTLLVPSILSRLGEVKTYMLLFALTIICAAVLSVTGSVSLFAGALLLRGGLFAFLNTLIDSNTMSSLPDEDRNSFAGLRSLFRSIGGAAAAYATGLMLEQKNVQLPFLITAIVMLISALYFWYVVRPLLKKQEAQRQLKP
ncbi:MFS transporter [Paenibacillus algorifonticola]|nr:MFS transporter [Paenibacillus algorifonticola]